MENQLKYLYDNYIKGYPENNSSEAKYVKHLLRDTIETDYQELRGLDLPFSIKITFDSILDEYVIVKKHKWDQIFMAVVSKKEHGDDAEKLVRGIYKLLIITDSQSQGLSDEIMKEEIKLEEAKTDNPLNMIINAIEEPTPAASTDAPALKKD